MSDLSMERFQDEPDNDYFNRLIYTAGCCWVRNMLLDNSLSNIYDDEKAKVNIVNGVSKRHLSERLAKILFGLISIIPCDYNRDRVNEENYLMAKSSNLAKDIINNMKKYYEVSELDDRIVTTPIQRLKFNNKTLVIGGNEAKRRDNLILTGIGKWDNVEENDKLYNEVWNIPSNHSEYLKLLTDNVTWKIDTIPDDLAIYNYHNNGYGISEPFWSKTEINRLNNGLYLGKTGNVKNCKLYLIKKNHSETQIAKLNEWYYRTKEYMRIIYASANKQGFCPRISAHIASDHVEIIPNCTLPQAEYRVIQLSSWTITDSNNKTIHIIPLEIWKEISQIFLNLGIGIKER